MGNSLTEEKTEEELWHEFKKTKSSAIRDKFIRQYMPLEIGRASCRERV